MFLTPHHFQQADRYYENLISRRLAAADENSGGNEREVVLAAKTLRILFDGEPPDDFVTLKIAELGRGASGKFQLNDAYVPPCLFLSSSPQLVAYLRRILEMLSAK